MTGPTTAECAREIEALHEFFVEWYTGATAEFGRVEAALAPSFEIVSPDGATLDRERILERVREKHDTYAPGEFDIDIRNLTPVERGEGYAVVRYEEWQTTPEGETSRVSTVVFSTDERAPGRLSWVTVHETWLDAQ